ncbi:protein of unknown function [Andreprevotia lacus DSM 23236]|jgi:hypothetical protein|uniref:DUF4188 domain-containing protein n=1 Tax=Andreprevotia lacus DSM 23236 TaxID=1121001 RepID=A0A1W1X955_9NEIS|nr:DUF4188 domain-containing protein [Andreprevotia lacus]SMC20377.1 protein of unknown function [Andreprevotia lacus DSM 23236]
MLHRHRMSATLDDEFVVFLIGMRINQWWRVPDWWQVGTAMPRMISELMRQPELGLLHAESWFGRTTLMVQYWRSLDQLLAYAKNREATHLPAWAEFNRKLAARASVGIWHETYLVKPGSYENIYVNMPTFGLGAAGTLQQVGTGRHGAAERMQSNQS